MIKMEVRNADAELMGWLEVPFNQPTNGVRIFLTLLPDIETHNPHDTPSPDNVLLTEDLSLKIEQLRNKDTGEIITAVNSEDTPLDILIKINGFKPCTHALHRWEAQQTERRMYEAIKRRND